MKLNLRKVAIPVIIAGVIVYGISKTGKIKNNEDYNNINQSEVQEVTNNNDDAIIDMDSLEEQKQETPIIEETQEEVKVNNIDGIEIQTKKVIKAKTAVNVRSNASTEGEKLGVLKSGDTLDYISQENEEWYKVKYNDEVGYIAADYSELTEETKVNAEIQKMICFKNDSKLYSDMIQNEIINDIPKLEAAEVYAESNGYYLASVNNKVGYVKKSDTQDLKNTFVIVDISDQQAYLYENNELIVSTPVVTGKLSTPTTKGLHEVWLIENDRFLKGDGYNVYVDYFMAFCGGEGLHDAEYHTHYNKDGSIAFSHGWRSKTSFGGELYKNGGSHGCVNMPYEATKTMSEHIRIGDKVLVKE